MQPTDLVKIRHLGPACPGTPDDLFICCASFEERCLGSVRRFRDYRCEQSLVFVYEEPDQRRERHLRELRERLEGCGRVQLVPTEESDPVAALRRLGEEVSALQEARRPLRITLDVTTFTKRHLLLLLRIIDTWGQWDSTRLVYTEPDDYVVSLDQPLSYGTRGVETIATFEGRYDPAKDLLLLVMLGYEGDRARALCEGLAPHHTILVIPRPAYHREWELRTEEMNAGIMALVGAANVRYADARNPATVARQLEEILSEPQWSPEKMNHYIAPLSTKPQAIGLYAYIRRHPHVARVVYAAPHRHNQEYFSTGVGPTWFLPR